RVGRDDCPGLADAALDAVGMEAEKLAAAVVEHADTCAACGDRRRALVPVTTLLAHVPPAPAPPELKKATDLRRRGGIVRAIRPAGVATCCQVPLPVAGGAPAVLVVGLVAVLWPRRSGDIARTAAPGGNLVVDARPVDFGPNSGQAELRITNTGRQPLVFETRAAVPWLSFTGGEGTLDPGA